MTGIELARKLVAQGWWDPKSGMVCRVPSGDEMVVLKTESGRVELAAHPYEASFSAPALGEACALALLHLFDENDGE